MPRFSFGEAFMHFAHAEGRGNFLLPFVLVAFLMMGSLAMLSLWLNAPIYAAYGEFIASMSGGAEPDVDAFTEQMNALNTRSLLATVVTLPLSIAFWAMLESAVYRRYMRGDPFGLKFGADELRVIVIGLLWVAFFIVFYIGLIVALIIPAIIAAIVGQGAPAIAAIVFLISLIAILLVAGWFAARLAPASALTIRDEEIRAFEGWKATKGKGRTLLGVWICWFIVQMVLFLIVFGIGGAIVFGRVFGADVGSDEEILAMMRQPAFWGPLVVLQAIMVLIQTTFHYIWAGPAALAAKTDPTWAGRPGVQEEFS